MSGMNGKLQRLVLCGISWTSATVVLPYETGKTLTMKTTDWMHISAVSCSSGWALTRRTPDGFLAGKTSPQQKRNANGSMRIRTDCKYWRETTLGDSHVKCMTCFRSSWLPKSEKDNYKPSGVMKLRTDEIEYRSTIIRAWIGRDGHTWNVSIRWNGIDMTRIPISITAFTRSHSQECAWADARDLVNKLYYSND